MDCRSFRRHHLAYLDNTLPGELLVAAECHVIECEACARHDTAVRRALMLARNLAPIEPSADFQARLEARRRAELARDGGRPGRDDAVYGSDRVALIQRALDAAGSRTRAVALAAGLLLLAYAAGTTLDVDVDAGALRPAPAAVAALPAAEPERELTTPDLVTSASTGVSVWPAALLADQVPVELMGAAQFQLVSYGQ